MLAVDAAEHGRVGAAAVLGQEAGAAPANCGPGKLPDVQQVTISAAGEYLEPSVSVRGDARHPDVARFSRRLDPACPMAVEVIVVREQATCRRGEYLRMTGRIERHGGRAGDRAAQ